MYRTLACRSAGVAAFVAAVVARAESWDFTAQFSTENGNPNGAWSYGWMEVGFGELNLFMSHGISQGNPIWIGWGGDWTPCIWQNVSDGWPYGVPPGDVSLHPGSGTQPSVARWTAPTNASGAYAIDGVFLDGDIGYVLVTVHHNGVPIWDRENAGEFHLVETIAPGDTLDFAVYGGYGFGNTPLRAVIEPLACVADLDGSGAVDASDLGILLGGWGTAGTDADLDGSGIVDAADLGVLLGAWGPC
ncbi:MAG: hypothetical protein U0572_14850 [Phycisphaerales bacterium]